MPTPPASLSITNIPRSKHWRDGNYNLGVVKLKCFINRLCPFEKSEFADHNLIFNDKTVTSIPRMIRENLSWVNGEIGVFLKQKHMYHSQYVYTDGPDEVDPLKTSHEQQPDPLQKKEFSWRVTPHVFLPSNWKIPRFSQYQTDLVHTNIKYDQCRWTTKRSNEVLRNPDGNGDLKEAADGHVATPMVFSVDPGHAGNPKGGHWRIEKTTPIFRGEDFFVQFGKINFSTDIPNRKGSPAFERYTLDGSKISYEGLDVTQTSNKRNEGVMNFDLEGNPIEKTGERFDFTRQAYFIIEMGIDLNYHYFIIIPQKSYPRFVKIIYSKSFEQAVAEELFGGGEKGQDKATIINEAIDEALFGGDLESIRVLKKEFGADWMKAIQQYGLLKALRLASSGNRTYRSFFVSEYSAAKGEQLIRNNNLKVSVRSHLGKIIVIFNDNEDVPWVVENTFLPAEKGNANAAPPNNNGGGANVNVQGTDIQGVEGTSANVGQVISSESVKIVDGVVVANPEWAGSNSRRLGVGTRVAGGIVLNVPAAAQPVQSVPVVGHEPGEDENPGPLFVVPPGRIAIWGGNTNTAVTFGPSEYIEKTTILLPVPSDADIVNDKQPAPLVLPGDVQILLSVRDMGLDRSAIGGADDQFKGDGRIRGRNKTPYYLNDAHHMTEKRTRWLKGKSEKTNFMHLGKPIKTYNRNAPSQINIKYRNKGREHDYTKFYFDIDMVSGDHIFQSGYTLKNCVTPVLATCKLVGISGPEDAWPTKARDISRHVLDYSETWGAQDFHKMEHTANMNLLINKGGDNLGYSHIEELKDKAFYVEIWAGYEGCNYSRLGNQNERDLLGIRNHVAGLFNIPSNAGFFKMMTGICYGGSIREEPGKRIMECKIHDYSKVLRDSLMFNSPFFDGVRDINAIYELLKIGKCGEKDYQPAGLIQRFVNADPYWGGGNGNFDGGRNVPKSPVYALPNSYNKLQGGAEFRFKDGDNVMSCIEKIAERSGKVIFFDCDGLFHYESFPIADIVFSPQDTVDGGGGGNIPIRWWFSASNESNAQLIFDQVTHEIVVEDVYNNIHIISTTPDHEYIMADQMNFPSVEDPDTEGFLGYRKTFLQMDGIFSDEKPTDLYSKHLSKFFRPPVVYKFKTAGLPMRCFDIADIDGQKLIVINVSQTIVARENRWETEVEGEWLHGQTGHLLT